MIYKGIDMYLRKSAKNTKKAAVPAGCLVAAHTVRLQKQPATTEMTEPAEKPKKRTKGATAQPGPDTHMFMEALAGLQQVNAGILQRLEQLEVQPTPRTSRSGYDSYPRGESHMANEGLLGRCDGRPIDDQVDDIYSQLEQDEETQFQITGRDKRIKSGQFRVGGEVPCRRFVWWPHDLCFLGPDCKRVVYDELTPLQWCCGFVRTILKTPSHATRHNMLVYISDLL